MTKSGNNSSESNNVLKRQPSLSGTLHGFEGEVCPYLKHAGDHDTVVGYPSEINHCMKVKPSTSPKNEHQREYCLTEKYHVCQIFQLEKCDREIKNDIFGRQNIPRKTLLLASIFVLGVFLGLLLVFPDAFGIGGRFLNLNKSSKTQFSGVVIAQVTMTPSLVFTETSTPTVTKTATPNPPTDTPTPIFPRYLETPIGLDTVYVIHQVVEGDSLIYLADIYSTTVDAIMAANDPLLMPIRDDSYLVIPYKQTDVTKIIPLTAYKIEFEEKSVMYIADRLGFEVEIVADLNAVPLGHVFTVGEWILLPKISE